MVRLGLRQLRAVVGGYIVFQRVVDLFERHVVDIANGNCSQHVVQIVSSDQMSLYLHPFTLIVGVGILLAPAELQEWGTRDNLAANQDVSVVALSIIIDVCQPIGHLHQVFVVTIDEDGTFMFTEEVVELSLRLADALERPKALQMGAPYVGNQATCRLGSLHQRLDVARMRCSHLHYGNVVFLAESEQGLGHTHVVVEVALCSHHVIAFRQHGAYQFLRRRLTIGSCNANDRYVELAAVFASQVFVGLQTIINQQDTLVSLVFLLVDNRIGATLLEGLQGKLVAIERGTFQGQKYTTFRTVARIGSDARVLLIQLIELFDVHLL